MEIEELLRKNGYEPINTFPTNAWKSPDKLTTFHTTEAARDHLKGRQLVQACDILGVKPTDALMLLAVSMAAIKLGSQPLEIMMQMRLMFPNEESQDEYWQTFKKLMEALGL